MEVCQVAVPFVSGTGTVSPRLCNAYLTMPIPN